MKKRYIHSTAACAALLFSVGQAAAQIDFTQVAISQSLTVAEIEAMVGITADTNAIDGIAVGAGADLFLIHRNTSSAKETFVRVDSNTKVGSVITDSTQMAADLGTPYTANMTLDETGFAYTAAGTGALYFVDTFNDGGVLGAASLIRIDLATAAASLVLRSEDLEGIMDFGALNNGVFVGARGEDGSKSVGIIDPSAPSWQEKVTEDDFLAAAPGSVELPPESVAVQPVTGDVYVFCHDELELFQIENIEASTQTVTQLDIPGLTGAADLHALVADADSNLYAFDEATESILVYDGTTLHQVDLDDIATAVGGAAGTFAPTNWRGLAVRKLSSTSSELFIASATNDYGVIRILFGESSASVSEWSLYE